MNSDKGDNDKNLKPGAESEVSGKSYNCCTTLTRTTGGCGCFEGIMRWFRTSFGLTDQSQSFFTVEEFDEAFDQVTKNAEAKEGLNLHEALEVVHIMCTKKGVDEGEVLRSLSLADLVRPWDRKLHRNGII